MSSRCSLPEPTDFYKNENGEHSFYDLAAGEYKPIPERPGVTILKSVKERTGVIKTNPGASLIDIGDGVACLEFHSKMNSIGGDTVSMMNFAIDEVEKNFKGLVVGNQGGNFSAGANIMMLLSARSAFRCCRARSPVWSRPACRTRCRRKPRRPPCPGTIAAVRHDSGHAGAHVVTADDGRVPDAHAGDVGDRVPLARR